MRIPSRKCIYNYADEIETWCVHTGSKFVNVGSAIECHFPEDIGLLHMNADSAYFHGFDGNKVVGTDHMVRTSGVIDGSSDHQARQIDNPRFVVTTLDDKFGTLEVFNRSHPVGKDDGGMLRVEVHFESDELFTSNWQAMTPEKRGEYLNALPASHHKQFVIQEIKSAGLEIVGLED